MLSLKISSKLPAVIGAITLATALVTGISAYYSSKAALEHAASQEMTALANARNSELKNYLTSIEEDLLLLGSNETLTSAFAAFNEAYTSRGTGGAEELRSLYIFNNSHPAGEKHKLDAAADGSPYSAAHKRYHPWLRSFLETRGYYDVFLVNKSGDVVYSVFKENDYATNLMTGEWRDSDLGNVFKSISADGKAGAIAFTDFAAYAPSADAPASFIATPVVDAGGAFQGALVFQMPVARINGIMQNAVGMGRSGETYLVGQDHLMRSDSRFLKAGDTSSILNQEVATETVKAALAGKSGSSVIPDYRGIPVLSSHLPITFHGVTWALMAEKDEAEVLEPVIAMRNQVILLVGIILVLMIGLGYFFARSISKPIVAMTDRMGFLANGDLSVDVPYMDKQDEIGVMARAVQVFKDNAVEVKRLQEEQEAAAGRAEAESARIRNEMADTFEATVGSIVNAVTAAATQMQTSAQTLSASSEETSQQSSVVSAAAEETSTNVQTVSSAAEELSSSISEINRQVHQSTKAAETAVQSVETTNQQVTGLTQASEKIEEVIALITDIAEQTNLLALNATIEAARAGEAGRGFAVVAAEVKELASQTAKATEEIGMQVKGIQTCTQDTVSAIQSIGGTIQNIREISSAIAAAVEEQGSATEEIARNIQQVAGGTVEVTSNITGVSQAASETGRASEQVLTAATDLLAQSEMLGSEVGNFLTKVRAG